MLRGQAAQGKAAALSSLRAGHKVQHPLHVVAVLFCFGGIRTLRGSERKKTGRWPVFREEARGGPPLVGSPRVPGRLCRTGIPPGGPKVKTA